MEEKRRFSIKMGNLVMRNPGMKLSMEFVNENFKMNEEKDIFRYL